MVTKTRTLSNDQNAIQQTLQNHEGLKAAKAKLNRLESERSAIQSRLDQRRAALNDPSALASKILNGESIEASDTINTEAENAKINAYDLAISQQRGVVQRELRSVSEEIIRQESPAHRQRAEELIASAEKMIATVDAMESHPQAMRAAGVLVSNEIQIFNQPRLRTLILGLKPIIQDFRNFVR